MSVSLLLLLLPRVILGERKAPTPALARIRSVYGEASPTAARAALLGFVVRAKRPRPRALGDREVPLPGAAPVWPRPVPQGPRVSLPAPEHPPGESPDKRRQPRLHASPGVSKGARPTQAPWHGASRLGLPGEPLYPTSPLQHCAKLLAHKTRVGIWLVRGAGPCGSWQDPNPSSLPGSAGLLWCRHPLW